MPIDSMYVFAIVFYLS